MLSAPIARPTDDPASPSRWFLLAQLLALSACAAYLAAGGRRDRRAVWLALTFLLGGSAFADPLLERAAGAAPAIEPVARALSGLQFAAFLPYAAWAFFGDFPRATTFGALARLPGSARQVCLWVGLALFTANAIGVVATPAREPWRDMMTSLDRYTPGGLFWPVVFALTAAALGYGIWNARHARIEERRRVRVLLAAIVIGSAPILGVVLLTEMWPLARRVILEPPAYAVAQWLVYTPLLAVPLATAYAVHVHQALDVSLYLRRALQYALARYSVLLMAATPFVVFVVLLYQHRDRRVVDLVATSSGAGLLAAGAAGVLVARARQRVLDALDRRFFRDQYDARRILRDLIGGMRRVVDLTELEQLVTREVDRALHLQSVALMVLSARGDHFVSRLGRARPLPVTAQLATLLAVNGEPLQLRADEPGPHALPDAEHAWLVDGGVSLLVPLFDAGSSLLGFVALGEKRSELPFTEEDHGILAAVGSATAVALERRLLAGARSSDGAGVATAGECAQCGLVSAAEEHACSRCGANLGEAPVPLLLAGKFLVEERIGAGGMGVVYRARDLSLDRPVAIKTLRPMGMLLAWRLRREARAMALVTHPNLAAIHGLESWKGTPILVVEYLSGGTLADRIAKGPLSLEGTIELGLVLLTVVDRIHRAGILHRDIKPSNIGFTGDGVPKLLDFGLARMMETAWGEAPHAATGTPTVVAGATVTEAEWATVTGLVLGTPEYMSPEAAAGEPPDPSFDLWSVAVVLYELLAGRPPFRGFTTRQTLDLARAGRATDLRELVPGCPTALAEFFDEALASERSRRPATAREMRERLLELRVA